MTGEDACRPLQLRRLDSFCGLKPETGDVIVFKKNLSDPHFFCNPAKFQTIKINPSIQTIGLAFLAGVSLVTPALAVVNIDYVPVGNAGNAADTTGYGAVSYAYNIGKYEVTNAQYTEFLNAKGGTDTYQLYHSSMASYGITQTGSSGSYSYSVTSGFENKPVVYVSWFDAARFTNWLGNGQGRGSTETGAYTLSGATSGIITVNSGATVYIPSEDE